MRVETSVGEGEKNAKQQRCAHNRTPTEASPTSLNNVLHGAASLKLGKARSRNSLRARTPVARCILCRHTIVRQSDFALHFLSFIGKLTRNSRSFFFALGFSQ